MVVSFKKPDLQMGIEACESKYLLCILICSSWYVSRELKDITLSMPSTRLPPKHPVRGGGGVAPVWGRPLLFLRSLNGLNLVLIRRHLSSGDGGAGGWLGLSWGGLTLLGLLVALRACRDPAAGDPSPWLALPLQGLLRGLDQTGHPVEHLVAIRAVSETGIALAPGALPADATVEWLELRMANAHDLNAPGLPALPLIHH